MLNKINKSKFYLNLNKSRLNRIFGCIRVRPIIFITLQCKIIFYIIIFYKKKVYFFDRSNSETTDLFVILFLFLFRSGELLSVGQVVDGDSQEHVEERVVAKHHQDDEVQAGKEKLVLMLCHECWVTKCLRGVDVCDAGMSRRLTGQHVYLATPRRLWRQFTSTGQCARLSVFGDCVMCLA